jgi:hypothetical protein
MIGPVALAAITVASGPTEGDYLKERVPVVAPAFELSLGAGFTQGWGGADLDRSVTDVAGGGLGAWLELGGRLAPHWSLTFRGEYQELANQGHSAARGVVANVGATYFASPDVRSNAWVRLAAGYRLLWQIEEEPVPSVLRHGFELGSLTLGWELRASPEVAVGPVLGADLNLFLWQKPFGAAAVPIGTPQVNTFIFAGVGGRFDFGRAR